MTTPRDNEFDARLRRSHAQSLEQVSPRTRARLAVRRGANASQPRQASRAPVWGLAAGLTVSALAVGALAIGLALRIPAPSTPATPAVASASGTTARAPAAGNELDEAYAVFDESPDLYLWLASEDARLAME